MNLYQPQTLQYRDLELEPANISDADRQKLLEIQAELLASLSQGIPCGPAAGGATRVFKVNSSNELVEIVNPLTNVAA